MKPLNVRSFFALSSFPPLFLLDAISQLRKIVLLHREQTPREKFEALILSHRFSHECTVAWRRGSWTTFARESFGGKARFPKASVFIAS